MNTTLTAIPGLSVGHWTNSEAGTGCTVVLCPQGAVAGVDIRGGAPGTRETPLLEPTSGVDRVHAVLLSGGSAYGLSAADGVMRWLEERGYGFDVGVARVPIVPAAILFDLPVSRADVRPDAAAGYAACDAATDAPVAQGNVGAGTGASCGKAFGFARATKAGIGSAAIRLERGVIVAALAAVNAFGDVVHPQTGRIIAGARNPDGSGFADTMAYLADADGLTIARLAEQQRGQNTTLAVVATNADLPKHHAAKVAQMAHDGLARVIRPIHTMLDGDAIFALSLGELRADVSVIGALAAEAVAQAVINAVWAAEPLGGLPCARDFIPGQPT
ncbi:MAG: peptidase S58 [Candidatus Roseilinea sp.]|nr:MAG: peptidase S58 [Candidatus Roseilinea sp.]